VFVITYSKIHPHANMPNVFGHFHTVNSPSIKLEQERTHILSPSTCISAIVLEILISFPWQ